MIIKNNNPSRREKLERKTLALIYTFKVRKQNYYNGEVEILRTTTTEWKIELGRGGRKRRTPSGKELLEIKKSVYWIQGD